jgi:hypothetical protein
MRWEMNINFSKNLVEEFICDNYEFQLYGDSVNEVSYKVSCVSSNRVDPVKFYTDIMYGEKISFYLGMYLGTAVVNKKAYIRIVRETNSYYLILKFISLSVTDYYEALLPHSPIINIHDSFIEKMVGGCGYPISTSINEIKLSDNSFSSKFHVAINVFNINETNINNFISCAYSEIIYEIGKIIKSRILNNNLSDIGLDYKFIAIRGYNSIKIGGFVEPITIDGIRVHSVTENSIILEDDECDKWNIMNIIPNVYNTDRLLYFPSGIIKENEISVNGYNCIEVRFATAVFNLNDTYDIDLSILESGASPLLNFIKYIHSTNICIYENVDKKSEIRYCGYMDYGMENKLLACIKLDKKLRKLKITFFFNNYKRVYFTLIKEAKKLNFRSIQNLIKSKFIQ